MKVFYIIAVIIGVGGICSIATQMDDQIQLQQQQVDAQQSADGRRQDNTAQLTKCFASANTAWTNSLSPDSMKALDHTGDLYYLYMQSANQIRQIQENECIAQYPIS
jgi:hypothetical protein